MKQIWLVFLLCSWVCFPAYWSIVGFWKICGHPKALVNRSGLRSGPDMTWLDQLQWAGNGVSSLCPQSKASVWLTDTDCKWPSLKTRERRGVVFRRKTGSSVWSHFVQPKEIAVTRQCSWAALGPCRYLNVGFAPLHSLSVAFSESLAKFKGSQSHNAWNIRDRLCGPYPKA